MNKKGKILFFCMIFVRSLTFAQEKLPENKQLSLLELTKTVSEPTFYQLTHPSNRRETPALLSPQFYAAHLGFFCKQEIKMEKITKIPLRFRLGSIGECDRLEGKIK